jgi:hypothetical protein
MKERLAGLWEPALPDQLADRLLGLGGADAGVPAPSGRAAGGPLTGRPSRGGPIPDLVAVGSGRGHRVPGRPDGPADLGAGAVRRAALAQAQRAVRPARLAAFAPAPRARLVVAGPPGRADRAAAGLVLPRQGVGQLVVGSARPRQRSRVRRTLISSAALMVLTVTAAAASDHATAAGGGALTVRPAGPTSPSPAVGASEAPVSFSRVSLAVRR